MILDEAVIAVGRTEPPDDLLAAAVLVHPGLDLVQGDRLVRDVREQSHDVRREARLPGGGAAKLALGTPRRPLRLV